ncbi:hypothetical protein C366_04344 [Cryptococcus neoformans Tu401-1]|nr:hypothetical protein C366_04344 [Cryptococcus neoformans var. grubii Tu401-1]
MRMVTAILVYFVLETDKPLVRRRKICSTSDVAGESADDSRVDYPLPMILVHRDEGDFHTVMHFHLQITCTHPLQLLRSKYSLMSLNKGLSRHYNLLPCSGWMRHGWVKVVLVWEWASVSPSFCLHDASY